LPKKHTGILRNWTNFRILYNFVDAFYGITYDGFLRHLLRDFDLQHSFTVAPEPGKESGKANNNYNNN